LISFLSVNCIFANELHLAGVGIEMKRTGRVGGPAAILDRADTHSANHGERRAGHVRGRTSLLFTPKALNITAQGREALRGHPGSAIDHPRGDPKGRLEILPGRIPRVRSQSLATLGCDI